MTTDDVALARNIITIPINPDFGSLNLAQAVMVIAYEWSKGEALASPPRVDCEQPAAQHELEGLLAQITEMLERVNYFYPPDREATTRRTLRTLLTKPAWNHNEVRTFRGILTELRKGPR